VIGGEKSLVHGVLNEAASAAIRSASWPSISLHARAIAAGSVEASAPCNEATPRFALCYPSVGTMSQLARIDACEPTTLNSKMSTLTPNASPVFGKRG